MTARDVAHAINGGQNGATPIAGKADPARYAADTLLRSDRAPAQGYNEPLHKEVAAVLAAYATGVNVTPEDASYLTRVTVAQGVPQAEAEQRVRTAGSPKVRA